MKISWKDLLRIENNIWAKKKSKSLKNGCYYKEYYRNIGIISWTSFESVGNGWRIGLNWVGEGRRFGKVFSGLFWRVLLSLRLDW